MSKKNGRKLFSKKDGTTFFEDIKDISDDAKALFDGLPIKLRKWIYESTVIIDALQKLDDALQEGEPADKAIDFILGQIKGDADERIYEAIKIALNELLQFTEFMNEDLDTLTIPGQIKRNIGVGTLIEISNLNELEADTVTQNAVYIYKS